MNGFNVDVNVIWQEVIRYALKVGPSILWGLITLVVGWKVIGMLVKWLDRFFQKADFDETLESFVVSIVSFGARGVLLISVAGILGFETTTLVTIVGAMAFAVGMALQGSLSNFAGGVLILIFRPFRAGDFVKIDGYTGTVKAVQILQTRMHTVDNKEIIIPNGDISNNAIVNYSATGVRRLDLVFGIGYGDDLKKAKKILEDIVNNDSRVIKEEGRMPNIVVGNLGENAVEIYCQIWAKTSDLLSLKYDMNEKVKEAFDKNGVSFPYPQLDVHLDK